MWIDLVKMDECRRCGGLAHKMYYPSRGEYVTKCRNEKCGISVTSLVDPPCKTCGGSGRKSIANPHGTMAACTMKCDDCGGSGKQNDADERERLRCGRCGEIQKYFDGYHREDPSECDEVFKKAIEQETGSSALGRVVLELLEDSRRSRKLLEELEERVEDLDSLHID